MKTSRKDAVIFINYTATVLVVLILQSVAGLPARRKCINFCGWKNHTPINSAGPQFAFTYVRRLLASLGTYVKKESHLLAANDRILIQWRLYLSVHFAQRMNLMSP